jgi:MFS family permease
VLLPGFLLAGAGVGLTNPAIASTAVGVVDPRRAGMASGINSTFRQVGLATGIAALGAIFQTAVTRRIADALPAGAVRRLPPAEVLVQGNPKVVPAPLRDAFLTGWTGALGEVLIVGAAIAFVGAIGALLLVRQEDFHARRPQEAPVGAA